MLTLTDIAGDPLVLTSRLRLRDGSKAVLRPLVHSDVESLAGFLEGLSPESRRLSTFDGYDLAAAENCGKRSRATGIHLQCIGLQPAREANLAIAPRSVTASLPAEQGGTCGPVDCWCAASWLASRPAFAPRIQ
ncbi:hypothetical protein ACWCOW_16700 [Streptomyces sp. NPDC001939]